MRAETPAEVGGSRCTNCGDTVTREEHHQNETYRRVLTDRSMKNEARNAFQITVAKVTLCLLNTPNIEAVQVV